MCDRSKSQVRCFVTKNGFRAKIVVQNLILNIGRKHICPVSWHHPRLQLVDNTNALIWLYVQAKLVSLISLTSCKKRVFYCSFITSPNYILVEKSQFWLCHFGTAPKFILWWKPQLWLCHFGTAPKSFFDEKLSFDYVILVPHQNYSLMKNLVFVFWKVMKHIGRIGFLWKNNSSYFY